MICTCINLIFISLNFSMNERAKVGGHYRLASVQQHSEGSRNTGVHFRHAGSELAFSQKLYTHVLAHTHTHVFT